MLLKDINDRPDLIKVEKVIEYIISRTLKGEGYTFKKRTIA
jgi:hypothetical protein